MTESHPAATPDAQDPHSGPDWVGFVHVMSLPALFAVFAALLALTYVTVAVTHYDLGAWNLWIAMGIATVKALLVALYFMHLRYDHPFNAFVIIVALTFVFLFVSLTLLDVSGYQPTIKAFEVAEPPLP